MKSQSTPGETSDTSLSFAMDFSGSCDSIQEHGSIKCNQRLCGLGYLHVCGNAFAPLECHVR